MNKMELESNSTLIPNKTIVGFSKLSKESKLEWVCKTYLHQNLNAMEEFKSFWHSNTDIQKLFDEFSENTLSNFYVPYGIVPNFKLNDVIYSIPLVIEESSVVAAASKAAKFWLNRGGFHAEILGTQKIGQVHFEWPYDKATLIETFNNNKELLLQSVEHHVVNMRQRGGGVVDLELVDCTHKMDHYFQLKGTFETCDAMGANFINTILESWAQELTSLLPGVQVIMSILSNYTPDCKVLAYVECDIEELGTFAGDMSSYEFVDKFSKAVKIAELDEYRATTHNKGIFNGVDAVVLATGNDFRAVEACGHAYASRDGQYRSLTRVKITEKTFRFEIELPIALGTVGGLTKLHPLAKLSLAMLNNPDSKELMKIAASVGLAQNFAAINSLVTTGIQKGHMKMHLLNILNNLYATEHEIRKAKTFFENKVVSFNAVRDFLHSVRNIQ